MNVTVVLNIVEVGWFFSVRTLRIVLALRMHQGPNWVDFGRKRKAVTCVDATSKIRWVKGPVSPWADIFGFTSSCQSPYRHSLWVTMAVGIWQVAADLNRILQKITKLIRQDSPRDATNCIQLALETPAALPILQVGRWHKPITCPFIASETPGKGQNGIWELHSGKRQIQWLI